MIDSGKELYLRMLLPDYSDADKMGYTKSREWCIENESYMWRYFIEKKCFTVMIKS
jgi:hypothetical protein